jgi:hypothetical protein
MFVQRFCHTFSGNVQKRSQNVCSTFYVCSTDIVTLWGSVPYKGGGVVADVQKALAAELVQLLDKAGAGGTAASTAPNGRKRPHVPVVGILADRSLEMVAGGAPSRL